MKEYNPDPQEARRMTQLIKELSKEEEIEDQIDEETLRKLMGYFGKTNEPNEFFGERAPDTKAKRVY